MSGTASKFTGQSDNKILTVSMWNPDLSMQCSDCSQSIRLNVQDKKIWIKALDNWVCFSIDFCSNDDYDDDNDHEYDDDNDDEYGWWW